MRVLEKLHIKPVFVFPGLSPNSNNSSNNNNINNNKQQQQRITRPQINSFENTEAVRDRQAAWGKYEHGQEEAARKLFEGRACIPQWDVWRMILRIFRHRNVEFLVAPYTAWAQVRFHFISFCYCFIFYFER